MLARLQQAISLAWMAALLAVVAWIAGYGWSVADAAALAALTTGHAIVLALQFVAVRQVHLARHGEAIPWAVLARAWWRELAVATPTFLWRQPWASNAVPDHLPTGAQGRQGVVLVHGFVCNRGLWTPWLRRLRERGVPFVAVNLEPVFGSIDDYPSIIEGAVRRVAAATGRPPLVVAHSMGGLATRAWLRDHGADDRVEAVITIGTPHGGTWIARVAHGHNAGEMRLASPWTATLARGEPASRAARFTCWWSECDQIVFPAPTAVLPGSDARRLPGRGHVAMALDEAVWDDLVARLR